MNTLKVAIIDDEPDAIASIELIINEFCKDIEVVAKANIIDKAWEILKETEPDLIFLDIDMPRGSGFDLLERFPFRKFDVIFITAYSKYVNRTKEYGAFHCLFKPVDIDLFVQTVEKFKVFKQENPNRVFKIIPKTNV